MQEDFELVRSALENRMATLCASISQQESIIQELQAEEQRAKEANNALNVRNSALYDAYTLLTCLVRVLWSVCSVLWSVFGVSLLRHFLKECACS